MGFEVGTRVLYVDNTDEHLVDCPGVVIEVLDRTKECLVKWESNGSSNRSPTIWCFHTELTIDKKYYRNLELNHILE